MTFSEPRRLTRLQGRFTSVAFSPDSKYIAYACTKQGRSAVGLMDRDTGKSTLLAGRDNAIDDAYYDVQFSPDGTFLIAGRIEEDGLLSHLCQIDIATRTQTRLTHTRYATHPSLSPDGKHVVYEEWDRGIPDLFRLTLADGEIRRLTDARADPSFEEATHNADYPQPVVNGLPRYSPDGQHIAYRSSCYDGKPDQPAQLFLMHADGSRPTHLTDFADACTAFLWHPDSQQIACTVHTDYEDDRKPARNLWKYRENLHLLHIGSPPLAQARRLEDSDSFNQIGSFHPSMGRYLAYMSSCGERFPEGWRNWDLRVLDTTTGDTTVLTNDDIYDTDPLFSPDGKSLVFLSERDNPARNHPSRTNGSDLYQIDW